MVVDNGEIKERGLEKGMRVIQARRGLHGSPHLPPLLLQCRSGHGPQHNRAKRDREREWGGRGKHDSAR